MPKDRYAAQNRLGQPALGLLRTEHRRRRDQAKWQVKAVDAALREALAAAVAQDRSRIEKVPRRNAGGDHPSRPLPEKHEKTLTRQKPSPGARLGRTLRPGARAACPQTAHSAVPPDTSVLGCAGTGTFIPNVGDGRRGRLVVA